MLSKRTRIMANRMGFEPEIVDDIVQQILLYYIEKPDLKRALDYLIIDAHRELYTRRRSTEHSVSMNYFPDLKLHKDNRPHPSHAWESLEPYLVGLKMAERVIMCLIYLWGFEPYEVADCFGITENELWPWLQMIQAQVKKAQVNQNGNSSNPHTHLTLVRT